MTKTWIVKKDAYCKGYRIEARELFTEYYDWEVNPMCDCTPARKYRKSEGLWMVEAFRTYCTERSIHTSREAFATAKNLDAATFDGLWNELTTAFDIPLIVVKDRFQYAEEDSKELAEAN